MNNVKTFFANNSVIRNMIRYYPDRNDYANYLDIMRTVTQGDKQ